MMKISGYEKALPIVNIKDYYRDDYEMISEILSCRWPVVVVLGLRRFGKTSLLKRIEGFVNQTDGHKEFISKGLDNWDRERDGNPPRKEFFDEIKTLNGKALYLSFSCEVDSLQEDIIDFIRKETGNKDCDDICFDKFETYLPQRIFILIDEFLKLVQEEKGAEEKRELFLKLHESVARMPNRDIVLILAEPPSLFSTFEDLISRDQSIAEISEAIEGFNKKFLNGLSKQEKHSLFCLKKTQNLYSSSDPHKIDSILEQLSGIPSEIQIAGETYFRNPEKEVDEILQDVAHQFSDSLKNSIIPTMTGLQRVFLRRLVESEDDGSPLSLSDLKRKGINIFHDLKGFGLVKEIKGHIKLTSEPIRHILCDDMEKSENIIKDEIYQRDLKYVYITKEERKLSERQSIENIKSNNDSWDGRIRIHHLSDMALSELVPGFRYKVGCDLDLRTLNKHRNPFSAYIEHIQNPKNRPHIIVITGDIALHHHRYCYKGVVEFLHGVMENITALPYENSIDLQKQIILVPGEMDISDFCDEESAGSNILDEIDSRCFEYFFEAFEKFGIPNKNPLKNSLKNSITIRLPHAMGAPGFSLEFLLFNSATMMRNFHREKRWKYLEALKLVIQESNDLSIKNKFDQLVGEEIGVIRLDSIERDKNKIGFTDDIFRIAVAHHNLNPHEVRKNVTSYTVDTFNAFEVKKTLLLNQFGIILHGHQRKPLFIKEKLYEKEMPYLKTMLMNGAGRFTDTVYEVDGQGFFPSFNCYVIQRLISDMDNETTKSKGDFKLHGFVYTYHTDENRFTCDPSIKEEISIVGD